MSDAKGTAPVAGKASRTTKICSAHTSDGDWVDFAVLDNPRTAEPALWCCLSVIVPANYRIDRKTGKYKKHAPHPDAFGFPRADLGLPIIFHFKDEGPTDKHDPKDQELRGNGTNQKRFASPVITKAIWVEGGFAPLIMVLDSPRVWEGPEVVLVDSKERSKPQTPIAVEELRRAIRRQNPLPSEDIRESFKEFCRENFSEVSL